MNTVLDEKTKKRLKTMKYVALIPFFGYLIVVFWSASVIDRRSGNRIKTLSFMFVSLIILALCAVPVILVIYFFILGKTEEVGLLIFLYLLLAYLLYLGAAYATLAYLNRK